MAIVEPPTQQLIVSCHDRAALTRKAAMRARPRIGGRVGQGTPEWGELHTRVSCWQNGPMATGSSTAPHIRQRKYSAPALEKGLDIIELLSTEERGLSQSEIARRMGRSVGEIFRMLVVLTERGYVVQDVDTDRYTLTTKLFEVANRTPLINRLTALAGPIMRRLTHTVNQSVHLGIASDDALMIVGQVDPPGNTIMSVRLGGAVQSVARLDRTGHPRVFGRRNAARILRHGAGA